MRYKARSKPVEFLVVHGAWTNIQTNPTVQQIDQWHKARGWPGIGYHLLIDRDGVISSGCPIDRVGYHVADFNSRSIGICLAGGRNGDEWENNYTKFQLRNLRSVLVLLHRSYPDAQVVGHRDLTKDRQCPGFDVQKWFYYGIRV